MRAFAIATTAVFATVAAGSSPSASMGAPEPSQIVRGLCQKDGCVEFSILDKQPVAKGADGELFRTRIAAYHADAKGRASQGEQDGFVFCSPTRPAVISAQAGQLATAFLLAPDDPQPAWRQRSSVNFFVLYFAMCHGIEAARLAAVDRGAAARSVGYHVLAGENRTVQLAKPEDILAMSQER